MLKNDNLVQNDFNNIKFLRKLQENVSKLDKLQQYEIFKIIKKFNNKLTENKNGIFINLSSLNSECICKINDFVNYSLDNQKRLDNLEILSQKILKNSINSQYNKFSINESKTKQQVCEANNLPLNLKSGNDKNKSRKNKDISSNKMENQDLLLNLDYSDEDNLEKEYILYEQNIETDNNLNIKGIINDFQKEIKNSDIKEDNSSKKNKFTGKRARLFKKCKETNKNMILNSLLSYNNYTENQNNELEDDEENVLSSTNINELTEDIID